MHCNQPETSLRSTSTTAADTASECVSRVRRAITGLTSSTIGWKPNIWRNALQHVKLNSHREASEHLRLLVIEILVNVLLARPAVPFERKLLGVHAYEMRATISEFQPMRTEVPGNGDLV